MLYVQQSLGPDEELVHVGRFHWMYTLQAFLSVIYGIIGCVAVIAGTIIFMTKFGNMPPMSWIDAVRHVHPGIRLAAFFIFILGVLRFAHMMVIKSTTEIAITNQRLVYKRGLVARYVGEISVDRIEGVNVLQSIPGRILGYGRLMIRGMGVGEVVLPPIADPLAFRKSIEKARSI